MEIKTMTRTQKVTLIALVVALVEGGAVALFAQGPGERGAAPFGGRGGPGGRGFAAGFALGQLDLSDAQKQQVRDITQRHRQQTQPLAQRLQQAMEAQRAAIQAIPVNESLVRSAAQDLAAAQADMAVEQARLHSDIFAVLTAEQQEKAKQLEAQAQARAKERQQRAPRQPKGQV
jgi:Spy/CpxP family protein refolding chaperone